MKRCTHCGALKDETRFAKRKASKDGLQPYCRICQRQMDKRREGFRKMNWIERCIAQNKLDNEYQL